MTVFSYWPTTAEPGAEGMNYSILMTGVVGAFALAYYVLWGKRTYNGPVVEVNL